MNWSNSYRLRVLLAAVGSSAGFTLAMFMVIWMGLPSGVSGIALEYLTASITWVVICFAFHDSNGFLNYLKSGFALFSVGLCLATMILTSMVIALGESDITDLSPYLVNLVNFCTLLGMDYTYREKAHNQLK